MTIIWPEIDRKWTGSWCRFDFDQYSTLKWPQNQNDLGIRTIEHRMSAHYNPALNGFSFSYDLYKIHDLCHDPCHDPCNEHILNSTIDGSKSKFFSHLTRSIFQQRSWPVTIVHCRPYIVPRSCIFTIVWRKAWL